MQAKRNHLEHDNTAIQVTAEHGEIVIGHSYGHNPRISGSIHLTPDEAGEMVDALNAAIEVIAQADRLAGRVR